MEKNFQWTDFYMELATKLLKYKNNRGELIKILKKIYKDLGMNYPFKEKGVDYEDICPFTVFGSFNKGIKDSNRIAILEKFSEEFSMKSEIPQTFEGIPVLMNMSAWFFAYKEDRGERDIDNLLNLFEVAIKYSDDSENNRANFISIFNIVKEQKGIRWNITMGLYWIRPYTFINLDSINRNFILDSNNVPDYFLKIFSDIENNFPTGKTYLSMCEKAKECFDREDFKYSSFPDLSYGAWNKSLEKSQETKEKSKETKELQTSKSVDSNVEEINYWIYSPGDNACMWEEFYKKGIMGVGWDKIPDLKTFKSKEDIKDCLRVNYDPRYTYRNDGHCLWQFANEMKIGDIIIVKRGVYKIIGRGEVTSDYIYDDNRKEYKHIRKVNWQYKGEWEHPGKAVIKTLTCITDYTDYVNQLLHLFPNSTLEANDEEQFYNVDYTKEDFLNEVYMDENDYNTLVDLLNTKLNIILQGSPGVGKTFVAKRLAYSIMGKKDKSRVSMVQFHQSYSYEDFIQGYRPSKEGFELANGVFYEFCKKAEEDNERPYFFIIDEINRGNLSKILGELMMLIESDKRGEKLKLLYSNEWFTVPQNVHIIGMMNTADRSLALMDYALRRRFAFYDFAPAFSSQGFIRYLTGKNSPKLNNLIKVVENLNMSIADDESLGEGFRIGHSYFCTDSEVTDGWLNSVVEYEIIPLIKEYWFDEPSKVQSWTANLREAIK